MDVFAKARAELATIDSQIAALQQRRVALRQFLDLGLSLYGGEQIDATAIRAVESAAFHFGAASAQERQREPAKPRILAACEAHIASNGPTRTHELLGVVQAAGIEIGSADPQNALSVLLSKSGRFAPDRKIGWSLKAQEEATPPVAPTTAGS